MPRLALVPTVLLCAVLVLVGSHAEAANRNRNRNRAAQSAAAKKAALNNAIAGAKASAQSAKQVADATANQALRKQGEAIESGSRFEQAKSQLAENKQAAAGALSEVHELRYRIEQRQAEDSPYRKALAEHAAAVSELDAARAKVHKSLDYQASVARAEKAVDRAGELQRVEAEALGQSEDYQAAKRRADDARHQLEHMRLEMYNADPDYVAAIASSREAKGAANKSENSLNASAMEKGIESINAKQAAERAAAAQAVANAAQAKLKQLESMKKQKPTTSSGKSASQKK